MAAILLPQYPCTPKKSGENEADGTAVPLHTAYVQLYPHWRQHRELGVTISHPILLVFTIL
jgi:hypothetical protein